MHTGRAFEGSMGQLSYSCGWLDICLQLSSSCAWNDQRVCQSSV